MKQVITLLMIFAAALAVSSAKAQRIELNAGADDLQTTVLEANDYRTVVRFDIGAFTKEAVEIGGETYYKLYFSKEAVFLNKGEPELPHICRSIIIPDDARMKINVLSAEYVDFPATPAAPSKGNLYRNVNPDDVPYSFGSVYNLDEWYPPELASIREPHILRDFRGTVVELNAFRYNPVSKTLRVYTSVTVEVVEDGPGEINILDRTEPFNKVTPDFELIYKERFINYNTGALLYTPIIEEGSMLIITYDSFHNEMLPFVEWKMQKGIPTTIVDVSTIGNNSSLISGFIQDFYDTTDLAWVLLVGDAAQVTTPYASGGSSDPSYAKVAGSDDYPDIFVGRFSAENTSHVQTQVERTVNYEKYPQSTDWYRQGTGIASDLGPGHHGEYDDEHMDIIRDSLLAYNYTLVDQIYDPNANSSMVANALNDGRSIVNYCGHGGITSWLTSGFSNSHVNALANDNLLPFIISVACYNGQFDGYTCFAEAWLRATHNGIPTGAIAAYMSSISQSWSPPMYGQDGAVNLLVADLKTTFGGICFNGSCYMIDEQGAEGVEMSDTWHIFGDPSVQLYTDTSMAMSVNHVSTIFPTTTEFDVEVVGIENALCALYREGAIYGSAYTDEYGMAAITISEQLTVDENLTLTVTAQNKVPYFAEIQIIAPEGAYVVFDSYSINDANGNNNGFVDAGESILLGMQLINLGPEQAYGVSATLNSADPYVTITDDVESFGDIAGNNGTAFELDAYAFDVSGDAPDEYNILFELTVNGAVAEIWISNFAMFVHTANLEVLSIAINDVSGNQNGVLDPGETAELVVTLVNTGSGLASSITGILSEDDIPVSVSDASGTFGDILPDGGTGDNSSDVFIVSAHENCPSGYLATFDLDLASDELVYTANLSFDLIVGDMATLYFDDFSINLGWTGLGGLGEWQIASASGLGGEYGEPDPIQDYSSGDDNQVLGNDLSIDGDYENDLPECWVISPVIDCSNYTDIILIFYRWLGVERNIYDHAYIEIYDGSAWVQIFANPSSTISDVSWNEQVYDISNWADGNPNFQIRFGIGITDQAWRYCGWNIDDVSVKGYYQGGTQPDIPTLSEWGMIILGLLLLAAGTVALIRRYNAVAAD